MKLEGQHAVVTGASRGIGRVIARRLASEGASVQLIARDGDALRTFAAELAEEGAEVLASPLDVTDSAALAEAAREARRAWGDIDLVVANAGLLTQIGPTWQLDPEGWWRDVEVNLRGSFNTCRAYVPAMVERNRGRVVLLGGGGSTSVFVGASGYAVAKTAVARLAETLDLELHATGVHAFAVSPGFVRTDMTLPFASTEEGRRFMGDLAERLEHGETTPPEDCADLVVRIADGSLDPLHGFYLHADADRHRLDDLLADAEGIRERGERVLLVHGL
jgi:NAD(P)-dependent dehydrogenase (short-subunit alcohol dehydrogenase family)